MHMLIGGSLAERPRHLYLEYDRSPCSLGWLVISGHYQSERLTEIF